MTQDKECIFVIDTDQYSGNFEREMTAFSTGIIGECEVGDEEAKKFHKMVDPELISLCEDYVVSYPDEHGCWRPTTIYRDKNGEYNSVAIYMRSVPPANIVNLIKERSRSYGRTHKIKVLGFRIIERKTRVTVTDLDV